MLWLAGLLFFAWGVAMIFESQTPEELHAILIVRQNPAQIALQGPVYGVENFRAGQMFAAENHLFTLVAVAIMNIFMIIRHTRGDEEKGCIEVVRSLPTGRLACIHAAMLTAACVNVVIAVSHWLLLLALGINGTDMAGALAYGVTLGVTGMFFAALTAFFAQLSSSAQEVAGYSFMFLLGAYLVRAVGDQVNENLARVSPFGLIMRAEVFVGNYLWPIIAVSVFALAVCVLAYMLYFKRDMDQGYIPERHGKAEASAFLRKPFGLAWRLNKNTLLAWIVGMFVGGAALGGLLGEAEDFAAENEIFLALMPQSPDFSITELFTMVLYILLAIVCIAPVLSLTLKFLGEEKDNRAEYILSGAVSRAKYMAGYVGIAFIASVIMPFATATGLWLVGMVTMDDPIAFSTMLWAIIVYVPALWVMLGLGVFVTGVLPKFAMLVWAYFAYIFIAGFFGDMLNLPEWAIRLSPMGFVPRLPLDEVRAGSMLGLTVVAVALGVLGFVFYRRRDIAG